ncbi:protein TONSOKU [Citrus sinensis]|nr:protein TONSOKU [Citrus sinensis]
MGRDEMQMSEAKRAYRSAKEEGNRQEEARWANVIGDILKNRGEYVEALKWFRIDYDVSVKYLPEKHLLPTCQSLGEVYLRLEHFKDALIYQKKHLELAKDASDLVEQQRACTQLGRTYYEMFLRSDDDHYSIRNAKKYFKSAMKLAQTLKENPATSRSSFLKEYIDAHNNIGMLQMELDNLEEAKKFLIRGLEICNEEEVSEDDDGRSRLHHNLGNVYMELRMWDKSREHIEQDIIICKKIEHRQGEAKGYINLGELHYRVQKYDEAILCYQKALNLAQSMEDEDALASQIDQNIETVKKAIEVMDELKKEEQNLKKLTRNMIIAKGTSQERKYLLQQNASLDRLIEKSSMIFAWLKHCEYAKRKKRIASELCDKGKLSDSFLVIGESYQKLRKFNKAIKWYTKSWETYKSIGNLEGQALAKVNMGNVLDSNGDWAGALDAFQEGYRIAVEANLPSVQLSALENMHYSHMIRFDNIEEARRLQHEIDKLKETKSEDLEAHDVAKDCCSETDTEGNDHLPDVRSSACFSAEMSKSDSGRSKTLAGLEDVEDDEPLISFLRSSERLPKLKSAYVEKQSIPTEPREPSPKTLPKSTNSQQTGGGRKRIRVVLSDDEGDIDNEVGLKGRLHKCPVEGVATFDAINSKSGSASPAHKFQDVPAADFKCTNSSENPINVEESTCSHKFTSSNPTNQYGNAIRCTGKVFIASDVNDDQCVMFRIDDDLIQLEVHSCICDDKLDIESLKVELACLYYLQLPKEKISKGRNFQAILSLYFSTSQQCLGLLPIIQHMNYGGRSLESFDTFKDQLGKDIIEVSIDGWVQKRLMKLYIECCKELSEAPNMKLLKKLYISEVEDEVVVSECELQDISVTPLLNALQTHKTVAMLDLSHNLLGNGTMEKLQQFFISSCQNYVDLTLDLHCNRFGPTTLFQICECPVLFTRLGVLNLSGNRLTDACGSYLSTILKNCKVLYSLNIENCSITSRTIQKVADALGAESTLAQLCIGYNSPVTGNAITNLLVKLDTLKSFSELNLNGLKLSKPVVDRLCQLAKTSCLTHLMLGCTNLGSDGSLQLVESLFSRAQESVKLDLSYCGLESTCIHKFTASVSLVHGILELNLGGNPIMKEGANALASLLMNPQCCLKVLVLSKCQLGLAGVLQLIKALSENDTLEELNLADNASKELTLQQNLSSVNSENLQPALKTSDCVSKEVDTDQHGLFAMNTDCNDLEVADSEDDKIRVESAASGFDNSCTSSCQKNSSFECQFVQELSSAIGMAKPLQLLDLSNNGFSTQAVKTLYCAWSSRSGAGPAWKHIKEQIIHFSVEGNKCCRVKPCCRKN